jgi:hypothetical protein
MKILITIFLLSAISACTHKKSEFIKETTCSRESLKYLKNPQNFKKRAPQNYELVQRMANTQRSMQLCYEDFKNRTGKDEFKTCLVVGVDPKGETEYYNFSSQEVELDKTFLECAHTITRNIPYAAYGRNYILIQAYNFYYQ